MAEVKTIKDIDNDTWSEFKKLAARNDEKLGPFFKTLVKEYKKESTAFWSGILENEKILSEKEARDLKAEVGRLRKIFDF